MMKSIFSLYLITLFSISGLSAQTLELEVLNNPTGTFYNEFLGELNGAAYIAYRDQNFDVNLYRLQGEDLELVQSPAGFTYDDADALVGDQFYLEYLDDDFITHLFSYDGVDFNALFELNPDFFYSGYDFTFNGLPYFKIFDAAFDSGLYVFDGTNIQAIPLPDNTEYGEYLGIHDGLTYLTLQDNAGDEFIYVFDGVNFTLIPIPFVIPFLDLAFQNDNGIYVSIFDNNFDKFLFHLDGNTATEIPVPSGYIEYENYVGRINDRSFVRYNNANFEGTVFEIGNNNELTQIPKPVGFNYVTNPGPLESDDKLYLTYGDATFFYHMGIFDGSTVDVIDNPVNSEFNDYYLEFKDGHLTAYWDDSFNRRLTYYDNTDFTTIDDPDGFTFFGYVFQYGTKAYFRCRDADFNNTLFSLSLNSKPQSADNTIDTERETPYTFSISDFTFSDTDDGDVFEAVQVVDLPTKGILHLFGAQVSSGQEIPTTELDKLNYVPLDNGVGQPYDSFTFKVSDGTNVSDETYTLFINVNIPVNTDELILSQNLEIFPNPAKDFVTVTLNDYEASETLTLTLTDGRGRVVETRPINQQQEIIPISHLPTGIYNVHIQNQKINICRMIVVAN